MKSFLKSKPGILSVLAFTLMMAFAVHRVLARRHSRSAMTAPAKPVAVVAKPEPRLPAPTRPSAPNPPAPASLIDPAALAENAAYLDRYYALGQRAREARDRQGVGMTQRDNAGTPADAGHVTEIAEPPAPAAPHRLSLRLQGRPRNPATVLPEPVREPAGPRATTGTAGSDSASSGSPSITRVAARVPPPVPPPANDSSDRNQANARSRPARFNPFGRVIKCELVFTLDSTNEQSPLVAVVMEPVYNNGSLVIPAGAELHGTARPDRLRDRIFSGQDWVLVFPRAPGRPSGLQLNVKGVALNRVEPDANGMTWGITDGSYGLEGRIIRVMNDEAIKRFVATFLTGSALALQDRQSDRLGQESVRNTPHNAVLQGFAANFQKLADEISAEIAEHGVFIRVPAGHQFYFYPMQIIDPDAADVSSDVATVR